MAEELKNLIEKIQKEGIETAQAKAKEIEANAFSKAAEIVEKAEKEAHALLDEARQRVLEAQKSSEAQLKQAGRDFLISLRKEVLTMLDSIVRSQVHEALDSGALIKIVTQLVTEQSNRENSGVVITVSRGDIDRLEKHFLNALRDEIKKGIVLRASDDISGGFFISYDSGKSYFDFTDTALADHIVSNFAPRIAHILSTKE